mmetsp:Transcript_46903/g.116904  ORF Transcript_46903/g.116904 Transcript_46903/m.116904 type:complete len:338 (+) Transcript_46903:1444-2457(+)
MGPTTVVCVRPRGSSTLSQAASLPLRGCTSGSSTAVGSSGSTRVWTPRPSSTPRPARRTPSPGCHTLSISGSWTASSTAHSAAARTPSSVRWWGCLRRTTASATWPTSSASTRPLTVSQILTAHGGSMLRVRSRRRGSTSASSARNSGRLSSAAMPQAARAACTSPVPPSSSATCPSPKTTRSTASTAMHQPAPNTHTRTPPPLPVDDASRNPSSRSSRRSSRSPRRSSRSPRRRPSPRSPRRGGGAGPSGLVVVARRVLVVVVVVTLRWPVPRPALRRTTCRRRRCRNRPRSGGGATEVGGLWLLPRPLLATAPHHDRPRPAARSENMATTSAAAD